MALDSVASLLTIPNISDITDQLETCEQPINNSRTSA